MAENTKQIRITKIRNSKQYDLEDWAVTFAKNVGAINKKVKKTLSYIEECKRGNDN